MKQVKGKKLYLSHSKTYKFEFSNCLLTPIFAILQKFKKSALVVYAILKN